MSEAKTHCLGEQSRKVQPKIRMVANGDTGVNTVRAELSGCIVTADVKRSYATPTFLDNPEALATGDEPQIALEKGKLETVSPDILASVFIETNDASDDGGEINGVTARKGTLATATVPLAEIAGIADHPRVTFVEFGESLAVPTPEVTAAHAKEPLARLEKINSQLDHRGGAGVLLGIIDVQGYDFAHPDFLDSAGQTRFVRIWDQGGGFRPSPSNQPPFDYGAEFKQEHLNAAIKAASTIGVAPQDLEPQSQMAIGSHGTHVASIAAGNTGVCPNAAIAAVLVSLPESDMDRRLSFYDSTRIAHAVDYLIEVARELDLRLSINISLGTNGHAHDASSAVSRWIDAALAVPGRCLCVAAGNAGQEVAAFEGDLGYVMGRIHTSGHVSARGLNTDIEWVVVGNGIEDVSENELSIWYGPQDRFAISLKPPGATAWIGPVEPLEFIENQQLSNGSLISIYNEIYQPSNGSNYIAVYLSPFLKGPIVGVTSGTWMVRLHGREVRDGHYHGWIERDDPRALGRTGAKKMWRFPSYFSERSNIDNSSVSSLACGQRIVSVANLDEARERVNITSSQGPTRDGRYKPDVAAPGTDIVAAKGFAGPDDLWISMSGTSMASPFTAGVAGLMLALEPKLTGAQIEGIIHRTSQPLPGATFTWLNDAGFGRLDPAACLEEASQVNKRKAL